jgi:hypothetical protein
LEFGIPTNAGQTRTLVNLILNNDSNSFKREPLLLLGMLEGSIDNLKLAKLAIDCFFMQLASSLTLHKLFRIVGPVDQQLLVASVGRVGDTKLSFLEFLFAATSKTKQRQPATWDNGMKAIVGD